MKQLSTPMGVEHTIDIDCPATRTLDFMNDVQQWLPWAMPQAQSVEPLPFGQWLVKTPSGFMKLRPHYHAANGVMEYELLDPRAGACYIPGRVVATPTGCQLAISLLKPDVLPQEKLESSMLHLAEGMHCLKLTLEQE